MNLGAARKVDLFQVFGGMRGRLEAKKGTKIEFVLININTRNGEENGLLIRTCEIKLVV